MNELQNIMFIVAYTSFWIGSAVGLANSPKELKYQKHTSSKIFILLCAFIVCSVWPIMLPMIASYKLVKWTEK